MDSRLAVVEGLWFTGKDLRKSFFLETLDAAWMRERDCLRRDSGGGDDVEEDDSSMGDGFGNLDGVMLFVGSLGMSGRTEFARPRQTGHKNSP